MKTTPTSKYWAIAFAGAFISFLLFFLINDKKVQKNNIVIENAMSKAELKISDELQKIDLVIESMSYFFESTPTVSQETFQRFTDPFKEDLNGIKALEWAPSVFESEKSDFFTNTNEETLNTIKVADESNSLINSKEKEFYYPISLINPKKLDWVLGFDLYSEKTRKSAIIQSTASKQMAFTGPIELVNDDNTPGILAIKTVFEPGKSEVKGVVAVVYRMDQFLQNTLSNEMDVLNITINDKFANNALLFSSVASETHFDVKHSIKIKAANRIWDINFYPKSQFSKFPHTAESYFILLLGMLTTALLITNLKGRDERNQKLEKKVWLRTKELEVSNKQKENLLREIHHRVMNNLQITSSLMNLQKRKLQDEEAIYALSSSQDRINAIALIHQKIYQHDGADAVDLNGYLENLIKSHKRISPNVKYTIDCPEVFIDLDSAVPLAIITSEIVINALKHAFK